MQPSIPLTLYKKEVEAELKNILEYWIRHTIDENHGGFLGRIDGNDRSDPSAPKGAVLHGRILWTFSAAYLYHADDKYLRCARRAYDYINACFMDRTYGGVYWTVTATGEPHETKKQLYACAFVLYGLAEYYKMSHAPDVLQNAMTLYADMNRFARDENYGGYTEAFARNWSALADRRLSEKDENAVKSMNTHLHILEAFANLYSIWPNDQLKEQIVQLLNIFARHIIDPVTQHLRLFFDERWNPLPSLVSYGHDIEAAWLLLEAAGTTGDTALIKTFGRYGASLAAATLEGLDQQDGGLWYEFDTQSKKLIRQKHWWPQAEAMVGFFNAWEVTGEALFLEHSIHSWQFIKNHLIDYNHGEWFWGIEGDGTVMRGQDKAGMWKCNYHNTRACLEIIRRIDALC